MAKKQAEPGFESLMEKARRFCLFRERSVCETEQKIRSWGTPYPILLKIMEKLKEENFLNDERFAGIYAKSKFNTNKWGKIKITAYLRNMRIPNNLIKQALWEIPEEQYQNTLLKLAEKKEKELCLKYSGFDKKSRIINYLLQKGYEPDQTYKVSEWVMKNTGSKE